MSAQFVIFWAVVGAAVGALVAAMLAWYQHVTTRHKHGLELEERIDAINNLQRTLKAHETRLAQQGEQLKELSAVRQERSTVLSELEQTRRTLSDLQVNFETSRLAARETEIRLSAALDAERQESAARRSASAIELGAAEESTRTLRAELTSTREDAARAITRLESDLAATRSLLEHTAHDLHAERTIATEARIELTRRLAALENDRLRLETELSTERRTNAEKQATLRSFVSTLREQYALACTERDVASREANAQRARADEATQTLQNAREEFSQRLDTEHEESVELFSRMWEYLNSNPRLRERPLHGPPPPPPASAELSPQPPVVTPESTARSASATPHTPPSSPAVSPRAEKPEGVQGASRIISDREIRTAPSGLADTPRPKESYDIEQALAEPAPQRSEGEQHPVAKGYPGLAAGVTKVRRPVSAMQRDQEVLVVCDDGSVWIKRPTGWTEEKPIPGSEVEQSQHPTSETERS